jgi:hypothetical protein
MKLDRQKEVDAWKTALQAGDSFFYGEKSVLNQLNLTLV